MTYLPDHRDLTPAELQTALSDNGIALIDVRETNEFAAERITGALNYPLSTFDPSTLPVGKPVVLSCAGGVRSLRAMDQCQVQGLDVAHHLAGGINAWKAAGLPTER